ncbi:MAG: hypothetical protein R3229_03950 [Alphaproteobacteria bacterium]|nr:hypothetical protein [Alphaproteobacteria bacterium]
MSYDTIPWIRLDFWIDVCPITDLKIGTHAAVLHDEREAPLAHGLVADQHFRA